MQRILTCICALLLILPATAQVFNRTELPTSLSTPWEITYGPDGFLWISEAGGKVSRVDPVSGSKTTIYTAADYFGGAAAEQSTLCFQPNIGAGTLGLTLHPDFLIGSPFIYYVYSYNSGTSQNPATKFKIARLTWNSASGAVVADTAIVLQMPTGYDHLGGRLMAIVQNGTPYLFFTVGDNGISETNNADCYASQANNPNNLAQNTAFKNGKVHRFNMNGSIPSSNPISGNSFYTRGHRNPQGLLFNSSQNIIYELEHGDRSDDEINILKAGMNYGWKNVRGYHSDNNFPGEAAYLSSYVPDPQIPNDALVPAFYSWCTVPQPTTANNQDWCTVAPSDGVHYNSNGIPEWTNSLLVVTLKNGSSTDQELYRFRLSADGLSLAPATASDPNPQRFFGADQNLNGRLRDIAISPDGTKIYLINNGGSSSDKITVYSYDATASIATHTQVSFGMGIYPNPSEDFLNIRSAEALEQVEIVNLLGETIKTLKADARQLNIRDIPKGTYFLIIKTVSGKKAIRQFIKT